VNKCRPKPLVNRWLEVNKNRPKPMVNLWLVVNKTKPKPMVNKWLVNKGRPNLELNCNWQRKSIYIILIGLSSLPAEYKLTRHLIFFLKNDTYSLN
ncbi:hypothetical protein LOTGIDRAFT_138367, partial [Lottia gigantea]